MVVLNCMYYVLQVSSIHVRMAVVFSELWKVSDSFRYQDTTNPLPIHTYFHEIAASSCSLSQSLEREVSSCTL